MKKLTIASKVRRFKPIKFSDAFMVSQSFKPRLTTNPAPLAFLNYLGKRLAASATRSLKDAILALIKASDFCANEEKLDFYFLVL